MKDPRPALEDELLQGGRQSVLVITSCLPEAERPAADFWCDAAQPTNHQRNKQSLF